MITNGSSDKTSNGHERNDDAGWRSLLVTWRRVRARVPEFERHMRAFGSVQLDRARLGLRRAALRIVVAALVATAAVAATITAAILFANGVAGGLAALCGGRAWLGNALAGVVILGALAAAVAIAYGLRRRRDWERLVRRYEHKTPKPPTPTPQAVTELQAQAPEI